jgi:hypothetical protein
LTLSSESTLVFADLTDSDLRFCEVGAACSRNAPTNETDSPNYQIGLAKQETANSQGDVREFKLLQTNDLSGSQPSARELVIYLQPINAV